MRVIMIKVENSEITPSFNAGTKNKNQYHLDSIIIQIIQFLSLEFAFGSSKKSQN